MIIFFYRSQSLDVKGESVEAITDIKTNHFHRNKTHSTNHSNPTNETRTANLCQSGKQCGTWFAKQVMSPHPQRPSLSQGGIQQRRQQLAHSAASNAKLRFESGRRQRRWAAWYDATGRQKQRHEATRNAADKGRHHRLKISDAPKHHLNSFGKNVQKKQHKPCLQHQKQQQQKQPENLNILSKNSQHLRDLMVCKKK